MVSDLSRAPKLKTSGSPVKCSECPIRHKAVCSRCGPEELVQLDQIKSYPRYQPGETIILAGQEMDFVGSVVSGVATLSQTMVDGRCQMVGLLLPSDFVGRPGRNVAPYDVVAITPLTMCSFRKKPFETLMAKTPNISERLLEMTLDELDAAREWMLILGRKTAREKISSLLAIIARRDAALSLRSPSDGMGFTLPLSRDQMADYLGLTLETVSRQMSALKKDGVISFEGKREIYVPDYESLLEEAGDDGDGGILA